jgi:ligand-binding sensor protein
MPVFRSTPCASCSRAVSFCTLSQSRATMSSRCEISRRFLGSEPERGRERCSRGR